MAQLRASKARAATSRSRTSMRSDGAHESVRQKAREARATGLEPVTDRDRKGVRHARQDSNL